MPSHLKPHILKSMDRYTQTPTSNPESKIILQIPSIDSKTFFHEHNPNSHKYSRETGIPTKPMVMKIHKKISMSVCPPRCLVQKYTSKANIPRN